VCSTFMGAKEEAPCFVIQSAQSMGIHLHNF